MTPKRGRLALLVAVALFVSALFLIEGYDAASGQPTISEEVQHFFALVGPQVAMLFGIVIGWFAAHFTDPWRR